MDRNLFYCANCHTPTPHAQLGERFECLSGCIGERRLADVRAEIAARAECARLGVDPDELCADGGITSWMVVDKELSSGKAA